MTNASDFERYRPALVRMAARLLSQDLQSRVDASDIVQEALLSAIKDPAPPRDDAGNVMTFPWLCNLVRRRLSDAQRFHRRYRRSIRRESNPFAADDDTWIPSVAQSIVDDTAGPETKVVRTEQLKTIQDAIASLPSESRELIRLKYEDGLKTSEIAAALGISESATKMRHLRIIESLRLATK